jgi:hypothetical protein
VDRTEPRRRPRRVARGDRRRCHCRRLAWTDCGNRPRRGRRILRCRGDAKVASGHLRCPVSRPGGAAALRSLPRSTLFPGLPAGQPGRRVVRSLLQVRRFSVRRRPFGSALAEVAASHWVTNETFLAGTGKPRRCRSIFTFAVSRCGDTTNEERCCRFDDRPYCDLSPGQSCWRGFWGPPGAPAPAWSAPRPCPALSRRRWRRRPKAQAGGRRSPP